MKLAQYVYSLKEAIEKIQKKKIPFDSKLNYSNFQSAERKYIIESYNRAYERLIALSNNISIPPKVSLLLDKLDHDKLDKNLTIICQLENIISDNDLELKDDKPKITININKIPTQIRDEIKADLLELDKCFKSDCLRSCVILCGRIIEIGLHAKYFKETGFDILEKNPGIGLGKLIAKLEEKGIKLDPGLTQQIHLVNNVRIFSVHKKQRTFNPTKQQTEAIILYTMDVIGKMF